MYEAHAAGRVRLVLAWRGPEAELSGHRAELSVQGLVEAVVCAKGERDQVRACPFHDDSIPPRVSTS